MRICSLVSCSLLIEYINSVIYLKDKCGHRRNRLGDSTNNVLDIHKPLKVLDVVAQAMIMMKICCS